MMPTFNVLYEVRHKHGRKHGKRYSTRLESGMIQVCALSRILAEVEAYQQVKCRYVSVTVTVRGFEVVRPVGVLSEKTS